MLDLIKPPNPSDHAAIKSDTLVARPSTCPVGLDPILRQLRIALDVVPVVCVVRVAGEYPRDLVRDNGQRLFLHWRQLAPADTRRCPGRPRPHHVLQLLRQVGVVAEITIARAALGKRRVYAMESGSLRIAANIASCTVLFSDRLCHTYSSTVPRAMIG